MEENILINCRKVIYIHCNEYIILYNIIYIYVFLTCILRVRIVMKYWWYYISSNIWGYEHYYFLVSKEIGPKIPVDANKMFRCLHITYTLPPVYRVLSLDY